MTTVDCEHRVWPITRNTLIWKMQWYVHRSPCILNLQLFNLQTQKSKHHFTYYSPFGLQDLSTQLLASYPSLAWPHPVPQEREGSGNFRYSSLLPRAALWSAVQSQRTILSHECCYQGVNQLGNHKQLLCQSFQN